MTNKTKARTFEGMKYRHVQRKNSRNRNLLPNEQQKWLKNNNYRNIGWNNIVDLFKKIKEIQQEEDIKSLSLEELFLEADRIGNKYLDNQEVCQSNLAISKELEQISNLYNQQFPDHTVEVIDYAQKTRVKKYECRK